MFLKMYNMHNYMFCKNVILWKNKCFLCEYTLKCNLLLWCKAEFSASLLQSSVSHDPSEIMLICCSGSISYYYQCWKQLPCGNYDSFFRIIWLIKVNVSLLNSFSVFQQDIHSRVINSHFEVLAHYRKLRQGLTDMNAQGWLNRIKS